MQIDWGPLDRAGDQANKMIANAGDRMADAIKQQSVRRAVQDYQADPKNANAIGYLYSINPTMALSLEKSTQERAEQSRAGETRSAQSAWMLSQGGPSRNGLMGTPLPVGIAQASAPGQKGNGLNALIDQQAGFAAPQIGGPASLSPAGQMSRVPGPMVSEVSPMSTSTLPTPAMPQPSRSNDPEWERYVQADPSGAMKSMLERQNLTKSQNEAMFTQMDMMARLARSAIDQPSYEAAIQRAQSLGIDTSSLPAEFDPAVVNAVELQAMSAKEYLGEQRSDRKFEWDVEDDQIDNVRDDRNIDSQVATRRGQLANTRRGQDLSDDRGRRGQDLTDSRGRRGQDLTDSRGRRGQDITDTRGRRGQDMGGSRGRGGRAGGSGDGAVIVNPQTGARMRLQNGQWVPA